MYDIFSVIYGSPFKSSLFNEKEGNDIIRIRDLKTYHPQVRSPEIIEKMEYVQPGDVLVGMDAEFRPCIWKGNRGALNQRVCKITTKYDLSPCFAFFILEPYLNEIESYKTGTTVSHIGKSDFDNIRIVIPSIENLKKLSEIINPLYRLIVTNGCEIEVLTTTRNCLLPKLMSGEIDVSNLDLSN